MHEELDLRLYIATHDDRFLISNLDYAFFKRFLCSESFSTRFNLTVVFIESGRAMGLDTVYKLLVEGLYATSVLFYDTIYIRSC
jgi:hypothetical protein